MLLTRLRLRNFRVYEDELDLELPGGLVGIYGANGAGKSTLLEAIVFSLWGKARTPREEIRSAGVGGDCVAEVEFEHEGHLYLVRRTLTGINATVRAEARCDGLAMSEGVRDTTRYVHSVLGMDDAAFRASVFAEQKQLAAFSEQSPAERRRLVLQLLGVTPLDAARDAARRDARTTTEQHDRLRGMLPDLDALRVAAADLDARAGAAEAGATDEARAAGTAEADAAGAAEAFGALDRTRQAYDALVIEGRAARQALDLATAALAQHRAELAALDEAAAELRRLEPLAEGAAGLEQEVALLAAAAAAGDELAAVEVPPEPPPPDDARLDAAQAAAAAARDGLVSAQSLADAAAADLARATEHAERSASLSGEADCPLCGQALGTAFEQVQAHRAAEVDEAARRAEERRAALDSARAAATRAAEEAEQAVAAHRAATAARAEWERAAGRRREAEARLADAWSALAEAVPGRVGPPRPVPAAERDGLRRRLHDARRAAAAAERLRGRLERRSALEAALAAAAEQAERAEGEVQVLRDKVRALAFDPAALEAARADAAQRAARAKEAAAAAQRAALHAAEERARANAAAQRLADGEAQHAQLGELERDARHLRRVADLLAEFRNTVVASVGPRLAVQAAELFGELTDNDYDTLEVDPDTFQLQISDGGRSYGLERFSGSEIDLANLALRVAISEQVRFQSGGQVGLLVLDEVFGPLDEDRKARMLLALERLRGRFRQVLVVTHDNAIKEQLPHAVEVLKRPGRRATARVFAG